jgi:hypothetical protein
MWQVKKGIGNTGTGNRQQNFTRVMAEAVTRTLSGSAAYNREAEPPVGHDLASAKSRGRDISVNQVFDLLMF